MRHNLALNFIASSLKDIKDSSFFVVLSGFLSPYIITGGHFCPDVPLSTANNILYIIELSVVFETNICIIMQIESTRNTVTSDRN